MLTRSLWSCTLNFCALKALLSGCWPGRMGRLCTKKRSRQCCRSGVKSPWATSTSLTCAVSPGATAAANTAHPCLCIGEGVSMHWAAISLPVIICVEVGEVRGAMLRMGGQVCGGPSVHRMQVQPGLRCDALPLQKVGIHW